MKKFKLSSELNEIFSEARKVAESNNLYEITLESIVYQIVVRYCDDTMEVECEDLKKFFRSFNNKTRDVLVSECRQSSISSFNSVKYSEESKRFSSSNIIISSILENSLVKSVELLKLTRSMGEGDMTITTLELLYSILHEEWNGIVEFLARYSITDKSLAPFIYGDIIKSLDSIDKSTENKVQESNKANTKLEAFSALLGELFDGLDINFPKDEESNDDSEFQSKEEQDKDDEEFEKYGAPDTPISTKKLDPNSDTPTLDEFGIDMTRNASEGVYDPIVGRSKELSQLEEILSCRKKNNALLLGSAGTGKTAVVEGLALAIAEGRVSDVLKDKKLISISSTDLTANCMYRGMLEARIQNLCTELKNHREIILYIDEFQQATSDGSSSIANMLKPSLGRGEITMIASTTNDEYRKFIEKDKALSRRFNIVQVSEPTIEETFEILKGIAPRYSEFHRVKYTEDVLMKCVEWSGKYINDKFFPDKAIGILDMSFSITKLNNPIDKSKVKACEEDLSNIKNQMRDAIEADDFDLASELKKKRTQVEKKLKKEQSKVDGSNTDLWPTMTEKEVSSVISKISGVPIDKIMSSDMKKLKTLKSQLGAKIIGQDEAIEQITLAMQRNVLGLRNPNKPIYSALLVGPTGTGKTLTAKLVASEFMGSEKNLETIACSEYLQEWSESKLLGSAPGYVGFSDTEPRLYVFKRKPYSVLLIDEIEKSSEKLYSLWLNILDEGEVTLSSGEKVSLRNCIVLFTSNTGTKSLELKGDGIGFSTPSEGTEERKLLDTATVMKEVEREFRPEFRNRLDSIIMYNSLTKDNLGNIFGIELGKLADRLRESGYELSVSDNVKDICVLKSEPKYGARSLQRMIVEYVEKEVCKSIIDAPDDKKKIYVDYKDSKVIVEFS